MDEENKEVKQKETVEETGSTPENTVEVVEEVQPEQARAVIKQEKIETKDVENIEKVVEETPSKQKFSEKLHNFDYKIVIFSMLFLMLGLIGGVQIGSHTNNHSHESGVEQRNKKTHSWSNQENQDENTQHNHSEQ
ncbi:MAG: hypothetical protein LBM95_03655 [Lactobacillales bacterium]|jgi:hypothetical protein|nr:hypothetical protein [Lactobacillales bacterium]